LSDKIDGLLTDNTIYNGVIIAAFALGYIAYFFPLIEYHKKNSLLIIKFIKILAQT
jgi:hypothetical protein